MESSLYPHNSNLTFFVGVLGWRHVPEVQPLPACPQGCQDYAEIQLFTGKNQAGAIFSLKNFGWSGRRSITRRRASRSAASTTSRRRMNPTIRPTTKQHLAWQRWQDDHTRFLLLGGGAGGGKSWHTWEKRLVRAYPYPGIRSFIGRKELKRLMQSIYATWTKVCAFHKIPPQDWKLNGQYNYSSPRPIT